ncbi:MAG: 5'(3')-deoxyribonucleotidase [Bacteroidota bacterium]
MPYYLYPMRICIDMDEVLADNYPKFLDLYKSVFGRRPEKEEYIGGKIYDLPGANDLRKSLQKPGWFADLPVIDGAVEVVEKLYARHEVFIVSSATEFKHSMLDKMNWLEKHFPFISYKRVVFCGEKSIAYGDYLIDDKPKNLRSFKGEGLLFTAPDNVFLETEFRRFDSWVEVDDFFEGA